ncbi:hypothetical protein C9374_001043 [Naegleria lovaniensis]|uniref:DEP domain-containing protein n=1 Tax=Naegleria lovaniensis TaxID=51637 RepID=A0AA88KN53_NAELO|nr:uncharacterized protein C9374_001043 [Naegleria lovaniensis]KAG2388193.1 hypothetical protein C9374_001043 [Naegleria lovaniensis]
MQKPRRLHLHKSASSASHQHATVSNNLTTTQDGSSTTTGNYNHGMNNGSATGAISPSTSVSANIFNQQQFPTISTPANIPSGGGSGSGGLHHHGGTSSSSSGSSSGYRKYILLVHEKDFSEQEIIINGKALSWLQIGDILEITQPKNPPNSNPIHEQPATASSPVTSSHLNVMGTSSTPIDITATNQNAFDNNNFSSSPFSSSFREKNLSNRAPTPPTIGSAGAMKQQAPSVGNVTISNNNNNQNNNSNTCSNSNKAFIVKISSLETMKGIQYLSISKNIADIFEFQPRREVYLRVIPKESAMLDYVVFSLRDHFLSRSDMWRFGLYLNDTSVYESKTLTWHGGIRVQVKELMKESVGKVSAGLIVYGHTKITYRSKSAVIYWLFQMSREMWEYDEYGNLNFERVINGFIKTVFDRWREIGVNHSLSIVLFSRHYLTEDDQNNSFSENREEDMASLGNKTSIFHSILGSKDGRKYVDFYKVVDWSETQRTRSQFIRVRLKTEFLKFQSYIQSVCEREKVSLTNSSAADGNFMEAINLVLNSFDKYYLNRDLSRTGQVILLVSPGCGMFNVQIPVLGKITTKRLMDVGLSVDLIALSVPPLHSVPIFKYKKKEIGFSNNAESPTMKEYTYYRSPDWINITFYRDNYFKNDINQDFDDCECSDGATNLFLPVSKMPNLDNLPTNLPLFEKYWLNIQAVNMNSSSSSSNSHNNLAELFRQHDEHVFKIFQINRLTQSTNSTSLSHSSSMPHTKKSLSSLSNDSLHGTPTKKKDNHMDQVISPKSSHGHMVAVDPHLEELRHNDNHHHTNNLPSSSSSTGATHDSFYGHHDHQGTNSNSSTPSNTTSHALQAMHHSQHHSIGNHHHHHHQQNHNSFSGSTTGATNINNSSSAQHSSTTLLRRHSPHSGAKEFMAEFAERHKAKELFYMKLYNPFHMDSESLSSPSALQSNNQQNTFHRKRWGHLHPSSGLRPTQKSEYIKHFLLNVNWQSMTEPACLPLTTDYWPESALKILNDFDLHTHSITDTNDIYQNNIATLVRELVCQRLHQGFQLFNDDIPKDPLTNEPIVLILEHESSTNISEHGSTTHKDTADSDTLSTNSSVSNTESSTSTGVKKGGRPVRGALRGRGATRGRRNATHASSSHVTSSNSDSANQSSNESILSKLQKSRPQKMEYCLSSANQFHRITYNPNISNMITIERYVPKASNKPTGDKSLSNSSNIISSLASSQNVVNNSADPFNNARSSYTYRYMLWNPTLDSYESRVTRFNSSVDYNWNKLDYLICGDHNQMTDELHNRSLQFHFVPIMNSNKHLFSSTTQLFGAFNNNSSFSSTNSPPSNVISGGMGSSSNGDLFSQGLSNSNEYSERIKSFRKFKDSIINRNFRAMDGDGIDVTIIGEESSPKDNSPQTLSSSSQPFLLQQQSASLSSPISSVKTSKFQYVPQEGGIDDNSRVEWINIVYKATYHPAEFWAFKVQWLVCTAALIDEFLQSLARRARQCGFAMIQTPAEIDNYTNYVHASKQAAERLVHGNYSSKQDVKQDSKQAFDPLENIHPFRSYVRIPISSFEVMYTIRNAVCEPPFNFIPDSFQRKLSKRFIHNSGCIMLHIDVVKGTDTALITWIDNPFQTFDLSIAPLVKQNEILNLLRKLVYSESTTNAVKVSPTTIYSPHHEL